MHNGMDPDSMSPAERLDEAATLLAAAMLRLWLKRRRARQAAADQGAFSGDSARNSLGCPAETRLPVTVGEA